MRDRATCHRGFGNPTGPRNLHAAARKSPIFDAAASGPNIEQSSVMSRNLRWLRARDLTLRDSATRKAVRLRGPTRGALAEGGQMALPRGIEPLFSP